MLVRRSVLSDDESRYDDPSACDRRLRWLLATGNERDAEILAPRHQILVLQRQIERPRFTGTDRTILVVLSTVFARSRLP